MAQLRESPLHLLADPRLANVLAANNGLFEAGKKLAIGSGLVAALLVAVLAAGNKWGTTPTSGQALGRVQAARFMRWVCILLALVGVGIMVAASG